MGKSEEADTRERRSSRYAFPSLASLKTYFSRWLPQQEIESKIGEATREFRIRDGVSETETRLQLVKKCEGSLLRAIMEPPLAGKPSGWDPLTLP